MQVLAKKGNANNPHANITLWQHTSDVLEATEALFGLDEPSRLCQQWFRFFKVPQAHWPTFRKRLTLAALWHDTGKASCSFQEMLQDGTTQLIRHEYLSFALLQGVARKLMLPQEDLMAISFAILGHHLKAGSRYLCGSGTRLGIDCLDLPITVYSADVGLQNILRQTEARLGLALNSLALPKSLPGAQLTSEEKWMNRLNNGREYFLDHSDCTPEFRALALALIASDSAGSGLRRTGRTITDWIGQCFPKEGLTPQDLESTIIKGRTQDIVEATGRAFEPNALQKQAQELGPRAVIISPCGSGKTLAAWLWAQVQLKTHKASRVLFLYPTRNTATEGFRDYVSWGKDAASLLHGTADYDLEGISFQGQDHPDPDKNSKNDTRHQASYGPEAALYSLGYWNKKYISATVDSFLSFSANNYGADCLLPLLCDSLVVVDEVHSFDPQMFTHLCGFLKHCDAPVLLMTATLPKLMRKQFEAIGIPVEEAPDPDGAATQERYHLSFAQEESNMATEIEDWILKSKEKKLLAVCNIVSRCQALGRDLQEFVDSRDDVEMIVYHSRFRLQDRQRIHEDVIKKFRDPSKRLILLSTQVCQMSLDLDADSLFTEIAPLPDLIQRMGRANRQGKNVRGYIRFFEPPKSQPYTDKELEEAKLRLQALPDLTAVTQVHLAELMASLLGQAGLDQDLVPLFGTDIPTLESSDYRLADDYTVDAVLPMDLEQYCQLREAYEPRAVGLVVPVPFFHTQKPERPGAPRFLRVAKADTYTNFLGFYDKEPPK